MLSLLTTYAVPLIGTAILGLFAKPNTEKPAIWKRILETFTKPSTTSPTSPLPNDLLKLLPSLLDQLLRKPPPVSPDEPLPTVPDPKSPQDLITYILSLLSLPPSPTAPGPDDVELISPVEHHNDIASLVACANAVAVANPEFDITVTVNENGVQVGKVKRAKPQ